MYWSSFGPPVYWVLHIFLFLLLFTSDVVVAVYASPFDCTFVFLFIFIFSINNQLLHVSRCSRNYVLAASLLARGEETLEMLLI